MDCASVLKRGYLVDKKASRLVSIRYDLLFTCLYCASCNENVCVGCGLFVGMLCGDPRRGIKINNDRTGFYTFLAYLVELAPVVMFKEQYR